MKNIFYRTVFSIFLFFYFSIAAEAAANLFLDAVSPDVNLRDTFIVTMRITTEGECVNAVSARIQFDPALLRSVDFSAGQSLLSLWTEPPAVDKERGIISFSGGIPGGYCGRVVGDPGTANILGKAIFTTSETLATNSLPAQTRIQILNAEVLLNDGMGTPAKLVSHGLELSIADRGGAPKNEWLSEVRADTIAPELFSVEVSRDPKIQGGKYFIAWSSTDKQSGIDHYEVLETNPWKFGFFRTSGRKSYWTVAESPYFLKDQNLRSKIMVKAIDKMGNERIVENNPSTSFIPEVDNEWIGLTAILSALAFLLSAAYMKKKKRF